MFILLFSWVSHGSVLVTHDKETLNLEKPSSIESGHQLFFFLDTTWSDIEEKKDEGVNTMALIEPRYLKEQHMHCLQLLDFN